MPRQVKITLGKDGSIKVQPIGFKSPHCIQVTKWVTERYGDPVAVKLLPEYYEEEELNTVTITNGLPSGHCG